MPRFSVPPAIPSAGDAAGNPIPQRVPGHGFSPEAKIACECVLAGGVAAAAVLVGAYSAMTGDTPALTVGVPSLCMMALFIAYAEGRRRILGLDSYVKDKRYAAEVLEMDQDSQIEELWKQMNWWRQQATRLTIDLEVASGSPARSADGNVVEFGRK